MMKDEEADTVGMGYQQHIVTIAVLITRKITLNVSNPVRCTVHNNHLTFMLHIPYSYSEWLPTF